MERSVDTVVNQITVVSVIETLVFPILVGLLIAAIVFPRDKMWKKVACVAVALFVSLFLNRFDWTGQADLKVERFHYQTAYVGEVREFLPELERAWEDETFSEREKGLFEKIAPILDTKKIKVMETITALETNPNSTKHRARYERFLKDIKWRVDTYPYETTKGTQK